MRITALNPSFVGFDELFNELERMIEGSQPAQPSFPPHNIVKIDDNRYVVELAVAGFGKEDIDIELNDGTLVIRGEKKNKEEVTYLYRGIATRTFTKSIRLNDTIQVRGAEFKDGILKIGLENVIPDHKKPRKIAIGNEIKFADPKLLTETI
jgi:molecular chaperone IbpA